MTALDDELIRLRDGGLGDFPPEGLPAFRDRCVDLGENLDVAWPFVLASAIEDLSGCWEDLDHESGQGVPTAFVDRLDSAIRGPLDAILASPNSSTRLARCRDLRAAVRAALTIADPI
jgi:hypothetical protein